MSPPRAVIGCQSIRAPAKPQPRSHPRPCPALPCPSLPNPTKACRPPPPPPPPPPWNNRNNNAATFSSLLEKRSSTPPHAPRTPHPSYKRVEERERDMPHHQPFPSCCRQPRHIREPYHAGAKAWLPLRDREDPRWVPRCRRAAVRCESDVGNETHESGGGF